MAEGRELACALHFQLEAAMQLTAALGGCILVVRSAGETNQQLRTVLGMEGPVGDVVMGASSVADQIGFDATTSFRAPRAPTAQSKRPVVSNAVQFRCIALCGRTAHRAFAHEAMLSGVVESGIALNIALAGEPFLAVPIGYAGGSCCGVLCLAYKASSIKIQFGDDDESTAFMFSRAIGATLARCPAAKYVNPYDVNRLQSLGLETTLPPEVTVLDGKDRIRQHVSHGMVYRSSSRAVLATRVERLQGEEIPSLPALLELSQIIHDLELLLVQQQHGIGRHVTTQHGLEQRLRTVQQDLTSLRLSAARDKSEGDAFRLSGQMLQQQLNVRIAQTEVAKLHRSEIQSSVNTEVLQFLERAKGLLQSKPPLSGNENVRNPVAPFVPNKPNRFARPRSSK